MTKLLLFAIISMTANLAAHESPSHSIEHLTEHIEESPTPELLSERALHYVQIGKFKSAIADLKRAHALKPKNFTTLYLLARTQLQAKTPNLENINQALALANNPTQKAQALALRASTHFSQNKNEAAYKDIQTALKTHPDPPLGWFFIQSDINLGRNTLKTRASDLKLATTRNPSAALHTAWIDAMIDSNQSATVLPIINKELNESRLKANWLIRRARAHQTLGNPSLAKRDLLAASSEIKRRQNPQNPNKELTRLTEKIDKLLKAISNTPVTSPAKPRNN